MHYRPSQAIVVSEPIWARRERWNTRWRTTGFLDHLDILHEYMWEICGSSFDANSRLVISQFSDTEDAGVEEEELNELQSVIEMKTKFKKLYWILITEGNVQPYGW